jgi:hypothetical protein
MRKLYKVTEGIKERRAVENADTKNYFTGI